MLENVKNFNHHNITKSIFLGPIVDVPALIGPQNRAAPFIDAQDHFRSFRAFLWPLSTAPREETFCIPSDNSIPHLIAFLI